GQGHEIPVPFPVRALKPDDIAEIRADYDREYTRFYDRPVPGSDVEIMSYAVLVATVPQDDPGTRVSAGDAAGPARMQDVCDTATGEVSSWAVYNRARLTPGGHIPGPAIIAEDETSTLVSPGWNATLNDLGYIELTRSA